jgi:6-pyruvoyltetrahydropterin/6-carboxytetrahydropterin synthase
MPLVTFTRKFSAAHRIPDDPGICSNIHGHNYRVEIEVFSREVDENGFVIPADEIKMIVDRKFDHSLILSTKDPIAALKSDLKNTDLWASLKVVYLPFSPSTENLAKYIAQQVAQAIEGHCTVTVDLFETDTIAARAYYA